MSKVFKVGLVAPTIAKAGGTSAQYLMADGSITTSSSTVSLNYSQTQSAKVSGVTASGVTIVSTSITTGGNPVEVLVTGDGENTVAGGWVKVQLFRDTTAIGKIVHLESSAASENVPYALTVIDTPSAGTYTYSLQTVSVVATGAFNFGETDGPVLTAKELNTILPTQTLSLSGSAPQISLTNGTGNIIKFAPNGVAVPSLTSYSLGTRIVLHDNISGSATGHAIGIESGNNWYVSNGGHKFYTNTTSMFSIDASGNIVASGTVSGTGLAGSLLSSATPLVDGTAAAGTSAIPARQDHVHPTDTSRQALNTNLTGVSGLATAGTGLVKNTAGTWSYDNSAYITGSSPTITTPTIDVINAASATGTTQTLFGNTSTGTINIGGASFTSGSILLGSAGTGTIQLGGTAVGSSGTINILTGATTSGTKTINIGTNGTTGSTTTITIGTTGGTNPTITLNGAVTAATSLTSTGTLSVNGTNPNIATTATSGTATIFNTTLTGGINIGQAVTGTINIGSGTATINIAGTVTSPAYNSTAAGTAVVFANTNTTGNITIGSALTSGTLQLGGTAISGGTVTINPSALASTTNIANGAVGTAVTKAVNIGTGATAGTTTIIIGSATGSTTNILGTAQVNGNPILTSAVTSLAGTTNQITASASTGSVTLSLPSAVTISGAMTAGSFIKSGGTSSQYLMADGSVTNGITLPDIVPLDNISGIFDGVEQRFLPTYQGSKITINNPLRLLITLNGIIQTVGFPETVWLSGYTMDGFYVDSDGYLSFSEVPPAGSTFDGRLMSGPDTQSTYVKTYPFRPIDILLGV